MPLTILNEITFQKEVLHSKFIVSLRHVEGDGDFDRHLREVKDEYPKAAHYCYGARIGSIEKMGDDGEPSHSAGLQILSALRYKKLDDVSIVVIRYFGGVKLGLPRLTRTYRECAEEAVSKACVYETEPGIEAAISIPYSELESIKYQLEKKGFTLGEIKYGEDVSLSFKGEETGVKEFLASLDPKNIRDSFPATLYKEVQL